MGKLKERIFWIDRNYQNFKEIGYPVTLSGLRKISKAVNLDLKGYLASGDTTVPWKGSAAEDDTFTVQEVMSEEELRKRMIWEDYDPWEDGCATSLDLGFQYPDFVHKDFRRDSFVHTVAVYTASILPYGLGANPAYVKYMEQFNIDEDDAIYGCEGKNWVTFFIQQRLRDVAEFGTDGADAAAEDAVTFTVHDYDDLLRANGLTDYVIEKQNNGTGNF